LQHKLDLMFEESDLVIAQEYIPTDFDWRIGVLDGVPIFACKYFMAKGHWQIYNWSSKSKSDIEGAFQCLRIEDVPKKVLTTALKVTSLIGRGLYGVDLKEVRGRPVVIEVNDNPNIDADVEDKVYGDEVYLAIMRLIRRRIEVRISTLQNPLRASVERSGDHA